MAEAAGSIFNKKAIEKLRSPDDLELYIRVTNPTVWAVLLACAALLAGLLAWGIFGSVSTNVAACGAVVDGGPLCLLSAEDATKVHVGDTAVFEGELMQVTDVSKVPISKEEAYTVLQSDYLVDTLMKGNWAYIVTFSGDVDDLAEGVPHEVSITIERVAPISLITRSGN